KGCAPSRDHAKHPPDTAAASLVTFEGLVRVGGGQAAVSSMGRARRGTSGALYLQSAPAGLNPLPRPRRSESVGPKGVEGRVPRDDEPRTPSGPEGSSGKRSSAGAAVGLVRAD